MKQKINELVGEATMCWTEPFVDRIMETIIEGIKTYKAPKAEWQTEYANNAQDQIFESFKNVIIENVFKN